MPKQSNLDPALNTIPANVHHIHLMGICGTGVGALAGMLKDSGFKVSGSDARVYPPMSDFLASIGIDVCSGYGAENLSPRPDLVIVGNVITKINPEAQALAELRIPYISMPQAISHYYLAAKTSLVVCGTHGKTTTSSILATVLQSVGQEPGFMIGGLVQAFGRNFNVTDGEYFVVEGDEYDTAFFDKGPKFLHYQPQVAILTSIEFDHADIYADLAAVKESFRKLIAIMPADGLLVAHLDDPVVRELVAAAPCAVAGYGGDKAQTWALDDVCIEPSGTKFTVYKSGKIYGHFKNVLPGMHNALNSLAVIAVLDHIGLTPAEIGPGLASFAGVRRRQEVRGIERGVTVIDDFAHHPTAVRETLAALRQAYMGHRLITVFEPRTNSSRRKVFQKDYVRVFDNTDLVLIKEPIALDKIPPEERFSAARLVDDLNQRGIVSRHFPTTDEIIDYLSNECEEGDVVAILSNGGFDDIHLRLLAELVYGNGMPCP